METDILDISLAAVCRQTLLPPTHRAVKTKETPPTEARNAHRPKLVKNILPYFTKSTKRPPTAAKILLMLQSKITYII